MGDLDALLRLYVQLNAGNVGTDRDRAEAALRDIIATPNMRLLVAET